jgi:NAD(P)-dependent dehydrogenase (short-subunit alcohol dehydrogenase family)
MNTNTTNKQVAIVTGASSGIGLDITQALIQHGYRVVADRFDNPTNSSTI